LTEDGSVYGAGEGATGALGRGSTVDSNTWIQTQTSAGVPITDVDDIYAPGYTTSPMILARKTDGTWWGLGDGPAGILGGGVVTDRNFWTQITELPTTAVRKVAFTGVNTTTSCYILFEDNTLWSAGNNTSGNQAQGNTTLKNTYSQIASSVADFWAGPEEGIANTTVWYQHTDGTLYTAGESNQYQTLMGNTTDKTTFSAATDIPSGFDLDEVWPLVAAEAVFAAWQRWVNPTTGEVRLYAVGYANDGTLGTNNFATTTLNLLMNDFLPIKPSEIRWMGGMHWTTGSFKGLGWMVDADGVLYVSGRVATLSAGSYALADFPFREGPVGGCEFFTQAPLYGALAP
jgi:alpha-tubulin suppressor-like RCC1 family protein